MKDTIDTVKRPTFTLNEHGQAVGTVSINGVPTTLTFSEPTMRALNALAGYVQRNPDDLVFAQLLMLTFMLVEPKTINFEVLCDLSYKEGKEVLKVLACFPDNDTQ